MKKAIAAILSIAAIALPQVAIAQTARVISRDSEGNVVIANSGIAPGTLVIVDYNLFPNIKTFVTSGACNLLTLKKSSTFRIRDYVSIGSTRLAIPYNTPVLTGSPCINGVINPNYPWVTVGTYKYVWTRPGDGLVVTVSGATGSVPVETDSGKTRLLKTDSCGRIVIKNSEKWKIEQTNDGGELGYKAASDTYWTLMPYPAMTTTNTLPHICYKKILYKPL